MVNSEFTILIRRSGRVASGLFGQELSIENSALVRSLLILHQKCSTSYRTPSGCMDGNQGLSECNERNPWIDVSQTKTAPRQGADPGPSPYPLLSKLGIIFKMANSPPRITARRGGRAIKKILRSIRFSRGRGGVPIDGTRNTTPAAAIRRPCAIFW